MVKFHLVKDEMYPIYVATVYDWPSAVSIQLTQDEYNNMLEVNRKYHDLQDFLEKKYNESID